MCLKIGRHALLPEGCRGRSRKGVNVDLSPISVEAPGMTAVPSLA
jgi:hypothetical protein